MREPERSELHGLAQQRDHERETAAVVQRHEMLQLGCGDRHQQAEHEQHDGSGQPGQGRAAIGAPGQCGNGQHRDGCGEQAEPQHGRCAEQVRHSLRPAALQGTEGEGPLADEPHQGAERGEQAAGHPECHGDRGHGAAADDEQGEAGEWSQQAEELENSDHGNVPPICYGMRVLKRYRSQADLARTCYKKVCPRSWTPSSAAVTSSRRCSVLSHAIAHCAHLARSIAEEAGLAIGWSAAAVNRRSGSSRSRPSRAASRSGSVATSRISLLCVLESSPAARWCSALGGSAASGCRPSRGDRGVARVLPCRPHRSGRGPAGRTALARDCRDRPTDPRRPRRGRSPA